MTIRTRRKIKEADAILLADWHIRPDTPLCRTDDFFAAQERKIDFIFDLAKKHNCPILVAGDLGDKSQWPNWLLEWFTKKVFDNFDESPIVVIPGQHDLPNHRLEDWKKSGIGVLNASEAIKLLDSENGQDVNIMYFDHYCAVLSFPYSMELGKVDLNNSIPIIALTHQMVIEDRKLWPDLKAPQGHDLLKRFPQYDLILSGDNHLPFVCEYEGRLLVNPGSIMRIRADQKDHKPRIYLWYSDTNTVDPAYLPIEQDVISREHIEAQETKDKRIEVYAKRIKSDIEIKLSFEDNLEEYFNSNRIEKVVKDKVWETVKGEIL